MFKSLSKQEIRDVIDRKKNPSHVPTVFSIWPPPLYKNADFLKALGIFKKYPGDISVYYSASYIKPSMRGNNVLLFDKAKAKGALDQIIELEDYADLDAFLKRINDPDKIILQPMAPTKKYRLGIFWNCLFENLWQIRGMENALTDMYLYPEEVHRIFRAITDFYKRLIVRARKEAKCDGFFVSDDIGHQNGALFSKDMFREFFYPYYKELIDTAHENGMHFWLHTCGNVTDFLPMFVEMGLDVIHPIQKYAMDEEKVFDEFKGQICFLYGFDVQQTIPYGTSEDVVNEVHRSFDIFSRSTGGFIFTQGNGITPNCPIDSYRTLLRESHTYNPYSK